MIELTSYLFNHRSNPTDNELEEAKRQWFTRRKAELQSTIRDHLARLDKAQKEIAELESLSSPAHKRKVSVAAGSTVTINVDGKVAGSFIINDSGIVSIEEIDVAISKPTIQKGWVLASHGEKQFIVPSAVMVTPKNQFGSYKDGKQSLERLVDLFTGK